MLTAIPEVVFLGWWTMFEIDQAGDPMASWEVVKKHFSVVLFTIQSAGSTLRDVTNFMNS